MDGYELRLDEPRDIRSEMDASETRSAKNIERRRQHQARFVLDNDSSRLPKN